MRALVTGGLGFMGLRLAAALRAQGAQVTVVDQRAPGPLDQDARDVLNRPGMDLVVADVTADGVLDHLGRYDTVFHLAAILGVTKVVQQPGTVIRDNALMTIRVVDWVSRGNASLLVFFSTSEVYAWTAKMGGLPIPTPEDVPVVAPPLDEPRGAYAASKSFGEQLVAAAASEHAFEYVIFRPHNIYGPRMGTRHVIPQMLARLRAGERPLVVASAAHRRAFCFVEDAVDSIVAATDATDARRCVLNIGDPSGEITMGQLAQRLATLVAPEAQVLEGPPAPHDPVSRRSPNTQRVEGLTGKSPRVPLDQGLRITVDWYLASPERLG